MKIYFGIFRFLFIFLGFILVRRILKKNRPRTELGRRPSRPTCPCRLARIVAGRRNRGRSRRRRRRAAPPPATAAAAAAARLAAVRPDPAGVRAAGFS